VFTTDVLTSGSNCISFNFWSVMSPSRAGSEVGSPRMVWGHNISITVGRRVEQDVGGQEFLW